MFFLFFCLFQPLSLIFNTQWAQWNPAFVYWIYSWESSLGDFRSGKRSPSCCSVSDHLSEIDHRKPSEIEWGSDFLPMISRIIRLLTLYDFIFQKYRLDFGLGTFWYGVFSSDFQKAHCSYLTCAGLKSDKQNSFVLNSSENLTEWYPNSFPLNLK